MFFKVTIKMSQPPCTVPIYEVYPILKEYKDFYNDNDYNDKIEMSMEEKDMWKLIKKLVNEEKIIISHINNNKRWFSIEIYDYWRE